LPRPLKIIHSTIEPTRICVVQNNRGPSRAFAVWGIGRMLYMPQNMSPSGRREVMGGLAKGLEVLHTFSRAKPHMTLSEIAARAGLPAATARRCLNTLEELGYVA